MDVYTNNKPRNTFVHTGLKDTMEKQNYFSFCKDAFCGNSQLLRSCFFFNWRVSTSSFASSFFLSSADNIENVIKSIMTPFQVGCLAHSLPTSGACSWWCISRNCSATTALANIIFHMKYLFRLVFLFQNIPTPLPYSANSNKNFNANIRSN